MTYPGYHGGDVGDLFDSMGNWLGSSFVNEWEGVYPSPGILDSPWAFPEGLDAYDMALARSNPGGIGLVHDANDIFGPENFISSIFSETYRTDYLLNYYASQESIDNMLNVFGVSGYDTDTDYSSLISDSYNYYNMGVNVYNQFDPGNAYLNDDLYYNTVMDYSYSVADWADT
ncbi:hypothetical protein [Dapis sp. BLCC M172]|uniref:hypothetical protein n=1 Tax=Dapis sp. BLCC M172 TaxID=2975281 RepID=UPI003CEE0125